MWGKVGRPHRGTNDNDLDDTTYECSPKTGPPVKIELLLQIESTEMKKAWYKQASIIISLCAVFSSVVLAIYTQMFQYKIDVRSKKEDLLSKIEKLLELRKENVLFYSSTDLKMRQITGSILTAKRSIYLESAEFLTTQIPKYVSSSEYIVLATEHIHNRNCAKAEHYYLKAIAASHTTINKLISLRGLAAFYFTQGPYQDFKKGRKYYREAVKTMKDSTDPYSIYLQGSTYDQWGFLELWNGFKTEGLQKIERAKKYYLSLPYNYPLKEEALEDLNKMLKQTSPFERNKK